MKFLILLIPVIIVSISFVPFIFLLKNSKQTSIKKTPKTAKKYMIAHYSIFFILVILTTILISLTKSVYAITETTNQIKENAQGLVLCFKYLSSALAVGVGCIGAGIGIGNGISSAIGAYSENEKTFSKALMFVAFGEGIAIYGLVVAFLILFVA